MKNKKIIILSILTLLIISMSVFLVLNKNVLKKLRADANEPVYRQAGFESEEVYKCVIDEYNRGNSANVSYDTLLSSEKISKAHSDHSDDTRIGGSAFSCELPNNTSNNDISLKGIEKIRSDIYIFGNVNELLINGLTKDDQNHEGLINLRVNARKVEISNNNFFDSYLYILDSSIGEIDVHNNKIEYFVLDTKNVNVTENFNLYDNEYLRDEYYTMFDVKLKNSNINNLNVYNSNIINKEKSTSYQFVSSKATSTVINNVSLKNSLFAEYPVELWLGTIISTNNLSIDNVNTLCWDNQGFFYCDEDSTIINITSGFDISNSLEIKNQAELTNIGYLSMHNSGDYFKIINLGENATLKVINSPKVEQIVIKGGDLSNFDFYNLPELSYLEITNNKLKEIDLSQNSKLKEVYLYNNKLNNIDLSKNTLIEKLNVNKNEYGNSFKYVLKNKKYNVKDVVNLPGNTSYMVPSNNILKIINDILEPQQEGVSYFEIHNDRIYTYQDDSLRPSIEDNGVITIDVNVYDISSKEYTIDKEKKVIEYEEEFNKDKVYITNGYTVKVEGDSFIISKEDDYVDTFKLVKKEKTTTKTTTTTKKNNSNNSNIKKTTEKRILYKDINLTGNIIRSNYLNKIKGYNRNIVLKNNDLVFKVNGLDNIDIINDINLNYKLVNVEEYNNEVKTKIDEGYVLEFDDKEKLSYKVLTEIPYSKIKDYVREKDIKIYLYKDNKYYMVSNNLIVSNNKLSFYMVESGVYVITNNSIDDSIIKKNISNNNKILVNNKSNNNYNSNKNVLNMMLIIIIISIVSFILLFILIFKKLLAKK